LVGIVRKAAEKPKSTYNSVNTQIDGQMYKSRILGLLIYNLGELYVLLITYTLSVIKSNTKMKFLYKDCLIKLRVKTSEANIIKNKNLKRLYGVEIYHSQTIT
jgi:hypothetical protein